MQGVWLYAIVLISQSLIILVPFWCTYLNECLVYFYAYLPLMNNPFNPFKYYLIIYHVQQAIFYIVLVHSFSYIQLLLTASHSFSMKKETNL